MKNTELKKAVKQLVQKRYNLNYLPSNYQLKKFYPNFRVSKLHSWQALYNWLQTPMQTPLQALTAFLAKNAEHVSYTDFDTFMGVSTKVSLKTKGGFVKLGSIGHNQQTWYFTHPLGRMTPVKDAATALASLIHARGYNHNIVIV